MQNTIIKLNYKSFGQGKPLIVMHGLFGMLDNWLSVAKVLAEEYQVFLIDLRNHGKSPHSDKMTNALMAEDLLHFMDDHWIYKASIIGHSMGGKVAIEFAKEHSDRIEKLIVVDISPKTYEGSHFEILDALSNIKLSDLTSRTEIDQILTHKINSFGVRQFLMKNFKREKKGGFSLKMNLEVLKNNYGKILQGSDFEETIGIKTLFVRGGLSPYISDGDWEQIQKWFSHVSLATIENAGHWVHADQKEEFIFQVFRFLEA